MEVLNRGEPVRLPQPISLSVMGELDFTTLSEFPSVQMMAAQIGPNGNETFNPKQLQASPILSPSITLAHGFGRARSHDLKQRCD